jgi:hypothetical protein
MPNLSIRNLEIDKFFNDEYKESEYINWDTIIHTKDTLFFSDDNDELERDNFKIFTLK